MQTNGHGNDTLMILIPVGVAVVVGVILFGGPAEAFEAINIIVRDGVGNAITLARAWF